ncbi:MAG TPA: hypothetical protein VM510_12800, partial [Caulifigura sp.]|nr:hypothetical protein [Caulifigura sp.]
MSTTDVATHLVAFCISLNSSSSNRGGFHLWETIRPAAKVYGWPVVASMNAGRGHFENVLADCDRRGFGLRT